MRTTLTDEKVPIGDVMPYPGNPRRGNVAAIAESLQTLGQYRPIVANSRTRQILRGNHTWRAAKALGWDSISVTWVDVEPEQARRIVLADNRIHDRGTDNRTLLLGLLSDLPDLLGTGYTESDLLMLAAQDQADEPDGGGSSDTPSDGDVKVEVGPYRMRVRADGFEPWSQALSLTYHDDRDMIVAELRRRLWLPIPEAPLAGPSGPRRARKMPRRSAATFTLTEVAEEAVTSLRLFPGNARQGDIGAIAESLAVNGQYSPLVARRSDRTVLVGNHTLQAVEALGWASVAVCWVDVDEVTAAKIVVADNRTASLGDYDPDALLAMLTSMTAFEGTGYDGDDVDDLLAAANRTPAPRLDAKPTAVAVGPWRTHATAAEWQTWLAQTVSALGADPLTVCEGLANALDLPEHCWESA